MNEAANFDLITLVNNLINALTWIILGTAALGLSRRGFRRSHCILASIGVTLGLVFSLVLIPFVIQSQFGENEPVTAAAVPAFAFAVGGLGYLLTMLGFLFAILSSKKHSQSR